VSNIISALFGWPGTWGAGGNMVAWVICGTLGFGWLHSKEKARHLAKMAQAARHHQELLDQAQDHHEALVKQQADSHDALIAHVTETAKQPVRRTGKDSS
jgi:hypothetical protein